jgi:hypothetical protein
LGVPPEAATVVKGEAMNSRVWPSGGALATRSAPTAPPAPVRLSMTNCRPMDLLSSEPKNLAIASLPAPGAKGTMIFEIAEGWARSCATAQNAASPPAAWIRERRFIFVS